MDSSFLDPVIWLIRVLFWTVVVLLIVLVFMGINSKVICGVIAMAIGIIAYRLKKAIGI